MNQTTEPDTRRGWLQAGLRTGLLLAAILTLTRWLTWEPYPRLMLPFDVGVCVLAAVLVSALVHRRSEKARAVALWLLPSLLLAWTLYMALWVDNLHQLRSDRIMKLAHLAALAGVGAVWLRALRRPPAGLTIDQSTLLLAVAFAVALLEHPRTGVSLLFPLALLVSVWKGLPRPVNRSGWQGAWTLPFSLAVLALPWVSPSTPGNGFSLPTPKLPPAAALPGRSVIFIVADTLRRDRLSLHGYARDTTPVLKAWAAGGVRFDDMSANSSWTLPSHASMFTGLYPRSHGAHGFPPKATWGNAYLLGDSQDTLAEIASDHGVETGAIVANHFYLSRSFGTDQGFRTYWVERPRKGLRVPFSEPLAIAARPYEYDEYAWSYFRARTITDQALRWLRWHEGHSFFLFLNYMDPHTPSLRRPSETVPEEDETTFREHNYDFWPGDQIPARIQRDIENNYDREILALDAELGRLFAYLADSGLDRRTSVVFTSDHGEYFGEHEIVFHSKALHAPVVNVPLVIRGPGIEPGVSRKPVQGIDLFPTVLDLLGLPSAPSQGVSVFAEETSAIVSEWYMSESGLLLDKVPGRFERDLTSLRDGPLRAILSSRGDAEAELYDLESDPEESRNLAAIRSAELQRLKQALQDWLARVPSADDLRTSGGDLSDADRRAAAELGYAEDE